MGGFSGPIAAVRFLIGGGTLVAVGREGTVDVLLRVPRVRIRNRSSAALEIEDSTIAPGQARALPFGRSAADLRGDPGVELEAARATWAVVRSLPPARALPTAIAPSSLDRTFAIGDAEGKVALYHSTSGRRLLRVQAARDPITGIVLSKHGDGLAAITGQRVLFARLHNPHPEVSLRTLLLPVWYEGYAEPRLIWQSSGGTDDFEPKLSLWPLIMGTFKATAYAMLISVPLALLAAIYVSLLAPARLQAVVKPTIELMAAVPTVVVGFLAALWLAPLLETALCQVLLLLALGPLVVVVAVVIWKLLPLSARNRLPDGSELLLIAVVGAGVFFGGWHAGAALEDLVFSGDMTRWLYTELGIGYQQRNAIVVGIALGFAVIPVIFTIAEDACSSVPKSLTRAARALGATRWQAAMRMVVPAASPGLFAAVMLGLGRAIGETMIVLMASGNTPILGLGPFDGMRTLAAAIAFEIPEANLGSSLYRVLFLTGLLLFAVTFLISTLAEIVGRALRRRYASF
jgi:phosphate transport system permease protein